MSLPFAADELNNIGDNSLDADPPPPVLDSVLGRLLLAGDSDHINVQVAQPQTRFFRPNSSIRPRKITRSRLGPPKRADADDAGNLDGNEDGIIDDKSTPDSVRSVIRDSIITLETVKAERAETITETIKSIVEPIIITPDSVKSLHITNPVINSINLDPSRSLLSSTLDRSLVLAPPLRTSTPPSSPKQKTSILLNGRPYTRLSLIGRGGSSKVFKVVGQDNKIYALKRVSFDKADLSAIQGYKNEIELLKKLAGHDQIIRLFDSETNDTKGYLLMLMEIGEIDLAHILQKSTDQQPDMNFVKFTWKQMLQAVHIIHESKIVHSDLKPANFLMVQGSLKLIDFGIAKAIANDTTNIHRDTQVGTVNYMSPEAIRDTGPPGKSRMMKLGRPSDVWSLGCILYQMVYGKLPFGHLTMYQKLQVIPDPRYEIPFSEYGLGGLPLDSALLQCLKSCLCRDPKSRMTIPQLLNHPFLRVPSASDKAVISIDQMFRLMVETLEYGQKGGDTRPHVIMRLAKDVFEKLKRDSP